MNELKGRRGQVTIFIIIALVIIGVAVILYLLTSSATTTVGFDEKNPAFFIQSCLEDDLELAVETVSLQGGSISPELYVLYQGNAIEYLCYTEEYFRPCIVQRPFLRPHVQDEIMMGIKDRADGCFNELQSNYVDKGYGVELSMGERGMIVELLPNRVVVDFDYILTISKGETERYESFNVILNNNLYELVGIADSITTWETRYGDADTGLYMSLYKDLKIEKIRRDDGTSIYILTSLDTEDVFQFASRSGALAPGYGAGGIAIS